MFSKFELTNNGVQLLNRVIAESKTLKFTKFQIGKGEFSGDKKTLTKLVSKFDEFNVTEKNVLPDNITNIKGFYDNRNVSVASKFTEIGLMAQLGDDSLTEVLFSYANQPTDEAETIPAKESYFSRTFSVMNRTDNVTSITFDLTIRQDKYNFGTLAEMKAADYLDIGDKVTLWGNAALGDSSFKMYIITNQYQPIQLNNNLYAKEYFSVYDGVDSTSKTMAGSANAVKKAYDKANNAIPKTDIVNDLTSGGTDKALSAEMGKELNENKQDKTDDELETDSKKIVGAINESLWRIKGKSIGNTSTPTNIKDIVKGEQGYYLSSRSGNKWNDQPNIYGVSNASGSKGGFVLLNFNLQNEAIDSILRQLYLPRNSNQIYSGYVNTSGDGSDNIYWAEVLTEQSKFFLGNSGISSVKYIQDSGTKTKNYGYIDKETGRLYKAKETNTDVTVTDKFEPADNISMAKSYLVESGSNSNGYYRKYSDGFIEQWGKCTLNYDNTTTVNLPIAFSNTNYFCTCSFRGSSTGPASYCWYVYSDTNKTFKVYNRGTNFYSPQNNSFYACGY